MLDLNRTMFYKARFDVSVSDGSDVLWEIVHKIRKWTMKKAARGGYQISGETKDWTAFKNGGEIKARGADVCLNSWMHIEGGVYTWACRYRENISVDKGVAPRQWVTEIGFEGRTLSEGTLSLVLSYGDRQGYIGSLQRVPEPSIPNLVKLILGDRAIECTVSGYDVKHNPIKVTPGNSGDVCRMILDRNREIPVVLVTYRESWDDDSSNVNPMELYGLLGPNAIICYTEGATDLQSINNLLRAHDLHCYAGSVRIYSTLPHPGEEGDSARHRFIPFDSIEKDGKEFVYEILRRALAQDINFWDDMLRMEDVRRLNRESDHKKRIADLKSRFEDEALAEMVDAEECKVAAERERDEAQEDLRECKQRNRVLEAQCENMKDALARRGNSSDDGKVVAAIEVMSQMPPTPREIADLVVVMYPDKLDFTEKGWRSLEDCGTSPGILYEALRDMCGKLHPLFLDEFQGDIVHEFGSISRFELARGEGRMTRKDKKLMAQREDVYQGRPLDIEKHVKSSTGNPNSEGFVRIYFGWDELTRKVVIGDCGGHKDNYSTRKRK